MKKNDPQLSQYVRKILTIVFLTNIPVILIMPFRFDQAIGWVAGAIASGANFFWLSIIVSQNMNYGQTGSGLRVYKRFYFRYLVLTIYSIVVVVLLKPDIVVFGLGLVSVQISIYLYHIYSLFRRKN
jgi:hypothetical protein